MRRGSLFVLAFFLASAALFSETIRVAVFDVARLGQTPTQNYAALARIMQKFDIVGCVDVAAPLGLDNIMKHMGNEWTSFVADQPSGRNGAKEYYGYIWKNGKMRMAQSLGYFSDPKNVFVSKPYGAEFETSDSDFTLVLAHIAGNLAHEVGHLAEVYDYFLGLVSAGNLILGGDFGRASGDAFASFLEAENLDDAAGFSAKTTIGPHGLLSSDDHIFVNSFTRGSLLKAGSYDYVPDVASGDYEKARETISAHLPIYIELRLGSE